ncbi:aldo/keto reductase [soil metagenome]
MIYKTLGKSDLKISALSLGCMGMSGLYGLREDAESIAAIHASLDAGVNFLDTADMYGPHTNEMLVGQAIADRREKVVLATKFGIVRDPANPSARGISGKPEYVRTSCEGSLKRLGVSHIDLYYQHRVDQSVPIEETVGAMAELVKAGKVKHLGLSEASVETIRRANKVHPIAALQSEYSLWSRDVEVAGVVDVCRELGMMFVAYSPLGRGFLTGQIKRYEDLAPDDFRRTSPRFTGGNFAKNLDLVSQIEQIAVEKHVTAAQLALAWVMAKGDWIVPLFGTKRRTYLSQNLDALGVTLSPEDLKHIEAVAPQGAAAGTRYAPEMMKFVNA